MYCIVLVTSVEEEDIFVCLVVVVDGLLKVVTDDNFFLPPQESLLGAVDANHCWTFVTAKAMQQSQAWNVILFESVENQYRPTPYGRFTRSTANNWR